MTDNTAGRALAEYMRSWIDETEAKILGRPKRRTEPEGGSAPATPAAQPPPRREDRRRPRMAVAATLADWRLHRLLAEAKARREALRK